MAFVEQLEPVLNALFGHIQFAGILLSLDRLLVGTATVFKWKEVPAGKARFELIAGCWMLRVFLFPS